MSVVNDFVPSKYQSAIFEWMQYGDGNGIAGAVAGSGKCLGKGTLVLMFDGTIKPVEHIRIGDAVMGVDSRPRRVLSVTSGTDQMFKVTPVKGDSWVCNSQHTLTLVNSPTNEVFDIDLPDYFRSCGTRRVSDAKLFRVGVEFPAQDTPLDPYLVGLWMGDGTTQTSSITNKEPEIESYCSQIASRYGCELVVRDEPHKGTKNLRFRSASRKDFNRVARPNVIARELRKLVNECGQKFVPQSYLINSRENRLAFLAGWIDTDGYDAGGYCEILTKYEHLKDSILYLARSLGFAAYATEKRATIKSLDFEGMYWRITISGDLSVIPTLVRKFAPRKQIKNVLRTGFSVSPTQIDRYYGFMLDGDGRFLLGDFTVTHNSTTMLQGMTRYARTATYAAFSAAMAAEFNKKLEGTGFSAKTLHSTGRNALAKMRKLPWKVDENKYWSLTKTLFTPQFTGSLPDDAIRRIQTKLGAMPPNKFIRGVVNLTEKARLLMSDLSNGQLLQIYDQFNIGIDEDVILSGGMPVFHLVRALIEKGKDDFIASGSHDYTDMLYLPVIFGLKTDPVEWFFIDECQDLSDVSRRLVTEVVQYERCLAVGDRRQAIMAFAGANNNSFDLLKIALRAEEFPLSVCYRCPQTHLTLAREVVPEIEAREGAPDGELVVNADEDDLPKLVQSGDLILCRVTAPLIGACIELIKLGMNARVKGKDIGEELISILEKVQKMPGFRFTEVARHLTEWQRQQVEYLTQKDASEQTIESLIDKCEAVAACIESMNAADMPSLIERIKNLFADKDAAIWFSSVHRSKGLEADRVFILRPEKLPLLWEDQSDDDYTQELNLRYVAVTRAKKSLTIFGQLPYIAPIGGGMSETASQIKELMNLTTIEDISVTEETIIVPEPVSEKPSPEAPIEPVPQSGDDIFPDEMQIAMLNPNNEPGTPRIVACRKYGQVAIHKEEDTGKFTVSHILSGLSLQAGIPTMISAIDLVNRLKDMNLDLLVQQPGTAEANEISNAARGILKQFCDDIGIEFTTRPPNLPPPAELNPLPITSIEVADSDADEDDTAQTIVVTETVTMPAVPDQPATDDDEQQTSVEPPPQDDAHPEPPVLVVVETPAQAAKRRMDAVLEQVMTYENAAEVLDALSNTLTAWMNDAKKAS